MVDLERAGTLFPIDWYELTTSYSYRCDPSARWRECTLGQVPLYFQLQGVGSHILSSDHAKGNFIAFASRDVADFQGKNSRRPYCTVMHILHNKLVRVPDHCIDG